MLPSLPGCPRSHCPTCCHHTHDHVHSHTRACSQAHLSLSLTHVSKLHRPSSAYGPNPRCLSHSPPLPHTCSQAPIYLPYHSHIHFCSQTSPHLLTLALLPLPHTGTFAASLGLNSLAFQCTHSHTQTPALPGQLVLGSQNLCTYTKQSQGMSRTLAGPSLPAMNTYYPALPRHTALGRPLLRPHSDTLVTPTGLCLPSCFPSSSLSSPCPPSSQNSPCVCGYRHLHRCHC